MEHIGKRIKANRKYKNLTLKSLAKEVGLSEQAISQYERGLREPTIETLHKISKALDIDITFLVKEHKFDGNRLKTLMDHNNLTLIDLSQKIVVPESTIFEFLQDKEILTNEDIVVLDKISEFFGINDYYLLGETNYKYFEDDAFEEFQMLIDEAATSKNDNIRIQFRDLLEIINSSIYHTISGNKEKELKFMKNLFYIIYRLQNTLSNDAYFKCYGKTTPNSEDRKPLSEEEIINFKEEIKQKLNETVDNFVCYYSNLEEWKSDYYFDYEKISKLFHNIDNR